MDRVVAPPESPVPVGGSLVGSGHPCFIIAEAGVNHNGDVSLALRLVDAAAEAAATAVKFQTFKASKVASPSAPKAEYQMRTTGGDETQMEMIRKLELTEEDHRIIVKHCRERGVIFLSSPFDEESVDFLCELGVPALKIPSGEITNLPFLRHAARTGKPLILSTGMSDLEEVRVAVKVLREEGNRHLVLLHCVSNYPADPADANLRAMDTMREEFRVPVGYSDHTPGIEVPLAAVALGACLIEKHLTLDSRLPGPDQASSSEPVEFSALVRGIRKVEAALGHGRKEPAPSEADTARAARRSLVATVPIPAGSVIGPRMIAARRPGGGIPPGDMERVLGKTAASDIADGSALSWEQLR
jgi:N-acetylneuraminate synthase